MTRGVPGKGSYPSRQQNAAIERMRKLVEDNPYVKIEVKIPEHTVGWRPAIWIRVEYNTDSLFSWSSMHVCVGPRGRLEMSRASVGYSADLDDTSWWSIEQEIDGWAFRARGPLGKPQDCRQCGEHLMKPLTSDVCRKCKHDNANQTAEERKALREAAYKRSGVKT